MGPIPGSVTSYPKLSGLKQQQLYLLYDSVGQEFGRCSEREFFCPILYQLKSLGGSQLMDGLVWVQDCFICSTATLTGWLEDWASLGLPPGAPTCGLPSMVVSGFLRGSSRLPGDPGRHCKALSDLVLEVSECHFLPILVVSTSLRPAQV